MIHEIFPVGPLACNCSILADETSLRATVIDPGADIDTILAVLKQHHLTVEQIIITHAHIDHVGGAVRLKRLTGVPVPEVATPDVDASDLLALTIAGEPAQVLYTPGHTEGSICLHMPSPQLLLAGDTLFAGSIGRTDLPGGDLRKILKSLKERVLTLPDATRVIPGHGPATTIGEERETNPFLVNT